MNRYQFFSTDGNKAIPADHLTPKDFSDDRYEGRYIMKARDGSTVVILSSVSADPIRWCVAHGSSTSYFPSHQQVMDHCDECGYQFVKEGNRK